MAERDPKALYQNPVLDSPDEPVAKNAKGGKTAEDEPDDLQEKITRWLNEAIDYYEDELEPDQVKATEYYRGELFGDEKEGRSKVVNTVVRDATLWQMGPLIGMIYEGDRVVEFIPVGPEDEAETEQQTDYIRHILTVKNPGFTIFWSWFMDGLVRRLGVVKYWVEKTPIRTRTVYTGLTEGELAQLAGDPEVEIETGVAKPSPDGGILYDVTAYRTDKSVRYRIEPVPNEEFVFSPGTRSLKDSRLYAHVREIPADDLYAMLVADGMDPDDADELIEENKGKLERTPSGDLAAARRFDGLNPRDSRQNDDETSDLVLYAEVYARVKVEADPNYDDEALPERRLFKCIGPKWEIVNNDGLGECVDEDLGFASWTPIPEPHTIIGQSNWDLLKDVQRIVSQAERGMLDSLAQSITPVTEVVNGMVNMQDFINPEVAGIRRVRAIGQTQTIVHDFVGGKVLSVLDYYNGITENRSGKARGVGIDADALQSTTKVAADAYVQAARQRIELIARVFCETGLRDLYQGLLGLVTKHQTIPEVVRLRGRYVEVDPRTWNASKDVRVSLPIGAGTTAERLERLGSIATKQQELLASGSPIVSNTELRSTLGLIVELSGYKDTGKFFKPWGPEQDQALQQALSQKPPEPDPSMALVEVERMKAATDAAIAEREFQLKKWQAEQENDRERDRMADDYTLREQELELKYKTDLNEQALETQVQVHRAVLDADLERERMATEQMNGAPA